MTSSPFTKGRSSEKFFGFTLVELLVVIGILAILLTVTLIAINPAKQFKQANDTKRRSNVSAILNAVGQYAADHHGVLPPGITSTPTVIGNGPGQLDICEYLKTQYFAAIPVDPLTNNGLRITDCTEPYDTNYQISRSNIDHRITITAPATELASPDISVTR